MPHTTTEKIIKDIGEAILEDYSAWLHKHSYIDADYYTEEPLAIETYMKEKQKFLLSSLTKLSESIKREILENAPKDEHHMEESNEMQFGINSTNKEWREIINNLGEKGE